MNNAQKKLVLRAFLFVLILGMLLFILLPYSGFSTTTLVVAIFIGVAIITLQFVKEYQKRAK